jgi:NAD(P)-dependent dehydrogenase (short-subunit alcohol dehydrogenase family)
MIVTGAGRGIGASVARRAGANGRQVCVNCASNQAAAEAVVVDIQAAGGRAIAVRADVADEAQVQALFQACDAAFGRLDALVNNAGVVAPRSAVADMSLARLQRLFAINVIGAFVCAREAVRRMSIARGGSGGGIVNLSSAAARLGSPSEYVDYAASKGAIDTMTLGLAKEVAGQGIRVNAVRPGLIDTDIHASGGQPDRIERLKAGIPMGRGGTADEVAATILWLLSDEAAYVTGALLDVSGGR